MEILFYNIKKNIENFLIKQKYMFTIIHYNFVVTSDSWRPGIIWRKYLVNDHLEISENNKFLGEKKLSFLLLVNFGKDVSVNFFNLLDFEDIWTHSSLKGLWKGDSSGIDRELSDYIYFSQTYFLYQEMKLHHNYKGVYGRNLETKRFT